MPFESNVSITECYCPLCSMALLQNAVVPLFIASLHLPAVPLLSMLAELDKAALSIVVNWPLRLQKQHKKSLNLRTELHSQFECNINSCIKCCTVLSFECYIHATNVACNSFKCKTINILDPSHSVSH